MGRVRKPLPPRATPGLFVNDSLKKKPPVSMTDDVPSSGKKAARPRATSSSEISPIPKKKKKESYDPSPPKDSDSGSEYSFSEDYVEEVFPKGKKESKKESKTENKKKAIEEPKLDENEDAEEQEEVLSDYDEDWRFTDPNMAVLRFQSRHMPKSLAYTAVGRTKGTASVALANAIDDNMWFPTPTDKNTPGGELFGYWQMKTCKYHTLANEKLNLLQVFNNKINTLLRPMYSLRQLKEPEFDILSVSVTTPVAVILPNKGECKFNGFAVCGQWLYSTKKDATVPVTQKVLHELGYLTIVDKDGKKVPSSPPKSPLDDLKETASRLEDAVSFLNVVVTSFKKVKPAFVPSTLRPPSEQHHPSTTDASPTSDGHTKESHSSPESDKDRPAMQEDEDDDDTEEPPKKDPPPQEDRKVAAKEEVQVIGLDQGEIRLKEGQSLEIVPHVKYYAVMPHKENVTKIYEKAADVTKHPPTTTNTHHVEGGHLTHHSRR